MITLFTLVTSTPIGIGVFLGGRIADTKVKTLENVGRHLWKGKMFYREEGVLRNFIEDPKSLDALYGPLDTMTKQIAEATDGRFKIQCFAAGEIVGAFQTLDAVSVGTVEMCQSPGYYFVGKDPVLALMGFERHTEKVSSSEYHVWFYRVRKGE